MIPLERGSIRMVAVDCTAMPVLTSVFGSMYTSRVYIM